MFKKSIKMYGDLKAHLKALTKIDSTLKKSKSQLNEVHAGILLNSLKSGNNHYDAFTAFSMLPSTIVHILNEILIHERKHIVEFGSGISTLYIARLIHFHKLDVKFQTIDQSGEWQEKLRNILRDEGITDVVTFISAPLTECCYKFKSQSAWYDTDILSKHFSENEKVDLLIVDGPVASVIPHARYPALPFMLRFLEKNKTIFIDDSPREGEQAILQEWKKILDEPFINEERYSYLTTDRKLNVMPLFTSFR